MAADARRTIRLTHWLIVAGLAIGLSYAFWQPLWQGDGLIGGDTYTYFLPQKTFYADRLKAGEIPLWNPLVGHGYPTVAESQTGVFYPTNLLLYRWLDVNTAYSTSLLLHFIAAFAATWLFARRMGLGAAASLLAALVFVYSWFPPRICLEWAVIGAVYFPLTLWCVESYLQLRWQRYLILLSGVLALHLLAGHYNLAFIEVLTCLGYAGVRSLRPEPSPVHTDAGNPTRERGSTLERASNPSLALRAGMLPGPTRSVAAVTLALVGGFALAAVQLVPTWELKQLSQRADVGQTHDPGYGHIPPWYLTQVVAPWMWYAPDVDADQALATIKTFTIPSLTNKVEAQLYFGLLPLALAVGGMVYRFRSGEGTPWRFSLWIVLGLAAVVYATGWLLPVTRHLPGFSYFMGPGRYGIIATMAVALLSAWALDRWMRRHRGVIGWLVFAVVFGITAADLWIVRIYWNRTESGAPAWYADFVEQPPIRFRDQSAIRQVLSEHPAPVRMLGTFQNAPTLTGFAMTPPYLGLGPAEYYDPRLTMPEPADDPPTPAEIAAQVAWLRQAGITHILSEHPLSADWPVDLVWRGFDQLLNPAAARVDPYYLYELRGSRGRFSTLDPEDEQLPMIEIDPEQTIVEVDCPEATTLVQTDLLYPGWRVTVDGKEAAPVRIDGMFRGVEVPAGPHTVVWSYSPASLRQGGVISIAAVLVLVLWTVMAFRRRARIPS